MKQVAFFTSTILLCGILTACCGTRKTVDPKSMSGAGIPGPKVIIYKTTKDYSKLVPVILSDDRKSLVSYPDIKDVYFNGNLAYPTKLNNEFLLDNRGINANVAFLNITYEEYSKLSSTPAPEKLMNMIIDKQPLESMYNCGARSAYKEIETELNKKIDAGDFSSFTKLK